MTVSSNEHDSYVEVRVLFDCKIFSRVWQLVSIKHCTMWARNLHDEWSKDSQGRSDKEREENKTRPDGGPGLHSQLWLLQKMETRDRWEREWDTLRIMFWYFSSTGSTTLSARSWLRWDWRVQVQVQNLNRKNENNSNSSSSAFIYLQLSNYQPKIMVFTTFINLY